MLVMTLGSKLSDLNLLMHIVHRLYHTADIYIFDSAYELVEFAEGKRVDVAFLEVSASEDSGLVVAQRLAACDSSINIIFMTDDEAMPYSREAWELFASAYLVSPITEQTVRSAMRHLRYPVNPGTVLTVRCFGDFEVYTLEGRSVHFSRSKGKELLAYLIYRKGAAIPAREAAQAIFHDRAFDDQTMRYFEKIAATLVRDLREVGADRAVIRSYNRIAANLEAIDRSNDRLNIANGTEAKYMAQYDWAHAPIDD